MTSSSPAQEHKESAGLNRIFMLFVPDRAATAVGVLLIVAVFSLGVLEMISRNLADAELYFYFSIAMMFFLVTMKYMSLRANMLVAQNSHSILIRHIKHIKAEKKAPSPAPTTEDEKAAAAREREVERAEMMEAVGALKEALKHIQPEAPIRPKYEATVEYMERILRNS